MDGLQISGAAGAAAVLGPGFRPPGPVATGDPAPQGVPAPGSPAGNDLVRGASPVAAGPLPAVGPKTLPSELLFQLRTTGGLRGVRGGPFLVSAGGEVLTPQGLPLIPPVSVPPQAQAVFVTSDGRVMALFLDGSEAQIGNLDSGAPVNPGEVLPNPNKIPNPIPQAAPADTGLSGPSLVGSLPPPGVNLLVAAGGPSPIGAALGGAQAPRSLGPGVGAILDFLV